MFMSIIKYDNLINYLQIFTLRYLLKTVPEVCLFYGFRYLIVEFA